MRYEIMLDDGEQGEIEGYVVVDSGTLTVRNDASDIVAAYAPGVWRAIRKKKPEPWETE